MGSRTGSGDNSLYRAAAKQGADRIGQAGIHREMVHIHIGIRHPAGDIAECDVRADGQAGQGKGASDHRKVYRGLFQLQAEHFFRYRICAQLLFGHLCRNAGNDQGPHNSVHQRIAGIQRLGNQINNHCRGHGNPAHQPVFLDHAERHLHQHKTHACHHGMHNGVARKGRYGGKRPGQPQDHHDDAAEQNHGEPVSSILAHIARQHDGLSLEGDGGH